MLITPSYIIFVMVKYKTYQHEMFVMNIVWLPNCKSFTIKLLSSDKSQSKFTSFATKQNNSWLVIKSAAMVIFFVVTRKLFSWTKVRSITMKDPGNFSEIQ